MVNKRFLSIGILAVAGLGLGACADQYAYGRAPGYYDNDAYYSQYDRYYGDPYGFQYVPVGYIGLGFGWYGDYYYPGTGNWVYDRRGVRRGWNQHQRAYWQPRVAQRQNFRRDNSVVSNRIGRGIAQQQIDRRDDRIDRRDDGFDRRELRTDRQGNRIERRENQVERRGNQIDRRGNQIERQQLRAQRQGNQIARQQAQAQGQAQAQAQAQGQARPPQVQVQRPARAERQQARQERQVQQRPQRELRQQYQRQQQSYRNGGRERRQPR